MASSFADMVKKVKGARASGGGNYIKEGVHRLRLKSARSLADRLGIPMTIAEFEVVETTSEDPNHAVGRQVDYVIKSTNEAYFGNLKSLILALYSVSEAEFDSLPDDDVVEIFEQLFGEAQAAVGREVMCDAIAATAKKLKPGQTEPTEYTRIRFSPIQEEEVSTQTQAEA